MVNQSDLFYLCSLIEVIGRKQKLTRKDVVDALGKENIDRIYHQAEILHCDQLLSSGPASAPNRFKNFSERDYDMDALEKELTEKSLARAGKPS